MMMRIEKSFIVTLFAFGCVAVGAATTNSRATKQPHAATNSSPAAVTATNAPAGDAPIPESVFVMPGEAGAGRDPFYPKTTRFDRLTESTASTEKVAPPPVAALKLNGLSGTPEHPLAIINGVTFGVGDEFTVPVQPSGRVRVLCVEVRLADESAVIEVGGQRKELRMRVR